MKNSILILSLFLIFSCSKENIDISEVSEQPATEDTGYLKATILGEEFDVVGEKRRNDGTQNAKWLYRSNPVLSLKDNTPGIPISDWIFRAVAYQSGLEQTNQTASDTVNHIILIHTPALLIPDQNYGQHYNFEKVADLLKPGVKPFRENDQSKTGFVIEYFENSSFKNSFTKGKAFGDQTGSSFEILSRTVNEAEKVVYAKCKIDCKLYYDNIVMNSKDYLGDFKGVFNVRLEFRELPTE